MLPQQVGRLAELFAIPGAVQIVTGNGGLAKVVISAPEAAAEMYLHGAHVTSWRPKGMDEVLYLSPNSLFQDGRAIRGGIPICFPWFGDKRDNPSAPAHGFVRTKSWDLEGIENVGQGIAVSMSTSSDDATRKCWPFEFRLTCRATFGQQLKLELIANNTGSVTFALEEALHAYFRVTDAAKACVRGLDGGRYLDKTDHRLEKLQSRDIRIDTETDRVYLAAATPVELLDFAGGRRIEIEKQNSENTVVWNPWIRKSVELKDLGAEQWKNFICIETCNVAPSPVHLEAGQSHTMTAVIRSVADSSA